MSHTGTVSQGVTRAMLEHLGSVSPSRTQSCKNPKADRGGECQTGSDMRATLDAEVARLAKSRLIQGVGCGSDMPEPHGTLMGQIFQIFIKLRFLKFSKHKSHEILDFKIMAASIEVGL